MKHGANMLHTYSKHASNSCDADGHVSAHAWPSAQTPIDTSSIFALKHGFNEAIRKLIRVREAEISSETSAK